MRRIQRKYPRHMIDVRGKGLLIGMEFKDMEFGYEVSARLFRRGVLVSGTLIGIRTIRIEPALTISEEQIQAVLERIDDTLRELTRKKRGRR